MKAIAQLDILKPENYIVNPEKINRGVHILQTWEPSHVVKLTIAFPMTIGVLQSLGTEKHQDLIEQVLKGEVIRYVVPSGSDETTILLDTGLFLFNRSWTWFRRAWNAYYRNL